MPITLPAPPPGSPFQVEYDRKDQVLLTWRAPFRWPDDLIVFAVITGFIALVSFAVYKGAGPAGPAVAALFGLSTGGWHVYSFLRRLRADRLTLRQSALCYEYEDYRKLGRRACEIPHAEVGDVRLDRVSVEGKRQPRQRLTLDHGAERLEIARGLTQSDQEWLAGVLRSWLGQAARAISSGWPGPPLGSSIAVERDDEGALHLHWQPTHDASLAFARWGLMAQLAMGFFAQKIVLAVLVGMIVGLAALGPVLGIHWVTLVFLLVVVGTLLSGASRALRELRPLLRSTEGRLTLGSWALHYEPGLSFDGRRIHYGMPRDIPRSEVKGVQLERTHSGQRLMVKHGAEQFEVGSYLREPEREWLAEILAAWATSEAEVIEHLRQAVPELIVEDLKASGKNARTNRASR
jgi:hypothetical protein